MRLAHANETRGKRSKRVNHAIKPGRPVLAGTGAASRHRPRAVRLLRPDRAGKTGTVPRTPGVIPIGVDTAWYARRVGVGSEPASEVAAPEIKRLDWRRLLAWRCFIAGGQNRPERPWQQKRENAKAPRNAKRLCLRHAIASAPPCCQFQRDPQCIRTHAILAFLGALAFQLSYPSPGTAVRA
jgi:hypothetical protein